MMAEVFTSLRRVYRSCCVCGFSVTCLLVFIVAAITVTPAMAQSLLPESSSISLGDNGANPPCRYVGKFEQSRALPGSNNKLTATGEFLYSCKRGLIWEVREPVVEILIYTQAQANFRVRKSLKVRHLQGPADAYIGQIMLASMSGDTEALSKEFELISADTLSLVPRSALVAKRLKKITIDHRDNESLINVIAGGTGDITIRIFDVNAWDPSTKNEKPSNLDADFCQSFSLFPKPVCRVLLKPADYIAPELD